ncbi:MAG: hypothetical protein IT368_06030 [Candidatus Hydrogenedentes bacterium]|nr:hypothetical protein [Candidatus Hydrogenedentota bacterium]
MSSSSNARFTIPHLVFATDSALPRGIDPPEKPPRTARFVARVDMFSQSPWSARSDTYRLSKNRRRSHWILWLGYYDDLTDRMLYQPYALLACGDTDAAGAAREMLEAAWTEERRKDWLSAPFEAVVADGLLKVGELRDIAARVWPREGGGSCS